MSFLSFGEYRPDVDDLHGRHTRALSGVLPRGDGYGPFPNLQAYTAALPAICRGAFYARKSDGTIVIFAATLNRLYRLDNTTLGWSDVSKGGVAYSDLSSTDQWQFAQFGNTVLAVQANTVPQAFDLAAGSAFADLGGAPPAARYVSIVGQFVVLSGLVGAPNRTQWCDLAGITTWTAGTGFANHYDAPDGGIVRGQAGGEFGVVFQESAIRRMIYVPGAKPAFQLERLAEEVGLLGAYSIVRAGERILFISQQGAKALGATGPTAPIGKERVDRMLIADIDGGSLRLLVGASDPSGTRAFWGYKSVGSSNTAAFDRIIAYDTVLDRWSPPVSVPGEYLAPIVKPGLTLDGLNTVSGSIDALAFSLDSVQAALASRLAAADTAHRLGFFDGSPVEAILATAEQTLDGRRMRVRGFAPRTDAGAAYGSVRHRANAQALASQTVERAINAHGRCPANIETRLARARLRIPAGTAWTYASGVEPDFVATGTR